MPKMRRSEGAELNFVEVSDGNATACGLRDLRQARPNARTTHIKAEAALDLMISHDRIGNDRRRFDVLGWNGKRATRSLVREARFDGGDER
jgi:hypothetical protein